MAVVWLLRKQGGAESQRLDKDMQRALDRLQRQLRRHALERRPWETWRVVAERVAPVHPRLGAALHDLSATYDRARYAPHQEQLAIVQATEAAQRAETQARRLPVNDETTAGKAA